MRLVVFIYIIVHIVLNSCFRKLDGVPRTKLRPNTVCHRPKRKPTRRNYTELEVSAEEEVVFCEDYDREYPGQCLVQSIEIIRENQLPEGKIQPLPAVNGDAKDF